MGRRLKQKRAARRGIHSPAISAMLGKKASGDQRTRLPQSPPIAPGGEAYCKRTRFPRHAYGSASRVRDCNLTGGSVRFNVDCGSFANDRGFIVFSCHSTGTYLVYAGSSTRPLPGFQLVDPSRGEV